MPSIYSRQRSTNSPQRVVKSGPATYDPGMDEITVFISYSHDSDEHREQVLALSERLRADGIKTLLDQYVNGSPQQGWPRWMLDQLDAADFVLVVCTETYYRRFRGHEEPGRGKGVDWEGALITQGIYDSRSRTLKFVPVFLSAPAQDWIPEPLRAVSHYALTSGNDYQRLYDFLLEQAGVEASPVGALKIKPRRMGTALTFGESFPPELAKRDIDRIIKNVPAELIGREAETKLLTDAWDQAVRSETKRPHVLTFVALGGEGKTSLVAKWAADLAHQGWPGCDAVFAWSFYHQGADEKTADSSDLFLKEALTAFGDPVMAGSAQGAFDKGRRLAHLVGERRALLILDGVEPLQYAPASPTPGELKDSGLAALLKGLAASNHGLCVVTTRYSIPDLRAYWQTTAPETRLTRLSKAAGVALLRSLGVNGTAKEFENLVEDVQGHALTLNLLGSYLHEAHGGDIRKRDLVKLEEADEEQGGHAFRVMDAYVQWFSTGGKKAEDKRRGLRALAVLRLLGLFDRPASADCLAALMRSPWISNLTEPFAPLTGPQRNLSFSRLEDSKLITVTRDKSTALVSVDTHPLVRDYFAKQLREQNSETWRAAHRRLFEHLHTPARAKSPPTLEGLQPLYQAVAHGCHAEMQQEALDKIYRDRILRGMGSDGFYSTMKLGAYASDLCAVTCFFEQPWSRVSPVLMLSDQAWLLNQIALCLRALGRLTEALEPLRTGLKMAITHADWTNAAAGASNLSELNLTLGEVSEAVSDAEQSLTYTEMSSNLIFRMVALSSYAGALHQAGRRLEAEQLFREAEELQAERDPKHPLLYSTGGFHYCDLLLTGAERAASRIRGSVDSQHDVSGSLAGIPRRVVTRLTYSASEDLKSSLAQEARCNGQDAGASQPQSCGAVSQRAEQTLKFAEDGNAPLLTIALDRLTLGRAALYEAILQGKSLTPCQSLLQHAVDSLRRAGQQDHLPRGLLTRAWLRTLSGTRTGPESAQSDLDEAWEIAERGPMPLFLADIHLHRARLFGRHASGSIGEQYPWESPAGDLAAARRLIEKHGYLRRMEELEDAEAGARKDVSSAVRAI